MGEIPIGIDWDELIKLRNEKGDQLLKEETEKLRAMIEKTKRENPEDEDLPEMEEILKKLDNKYPSG